MRIPDDNHFNCLKLFQPWSLGRYSSRKCSHHQVHCRFHCKAVRDTVEWLKIYQREIRRSEFYMGFHERMFFHQFLWYHPLFKKHFKHKGCEESFNTMYVSRSELRYGKGIPIPVPAGICNKSMNMMFQLVISPKVCGSRIPPGYFTAAGCCALIRE